MKRKQLSGDSLHIIFICITTALLLLTLNVVSGQLGNSNAYNSYMLQAQAWLGGHLSLDRDYPHLELAIFKNKYFVSFPPFPSYLMLPFALIKFEKGDAVIALISAVAASAYAFKIMRHFELDSKKSMFWSLFITVGSNWLFCAVTPWVWFIAQNLAFTLSLMAIYYALSGRAGLSLSFWACAVGCRPLQAIYIIVLAYILYKNFYDNGMNLKDMIFAKWKCLIAPLIIAVSYMVLNYARFGNIAEFGHNYLPEFTRTTTGQFNISYLAENIKHLFRFPFQSGSHNFINSNGFCIFIASPVFISYIVYSVIALKDKQKCPLVLALFAIIVIHLIAIALHRTMGGAHYGNRYTNDVLPFVLLSIAYTIPKNEKWGEFNVLPFLLGFALNVLWVFMYYHN